MTNDQILEYLPVIKLAAWARRRAEPRLHAEDAEDLVQSCVAWLLESGRPIPAAKAHGWVYRLAAGYMANRTRSDMRYEDMEHGEPPCHEPAAPSFTLPHGVSREELQHALQTLPPEQAAILKDLFFDNQTLGEVAVTTGKSIMVVSRLRDLALSSLRKFFETRPTCQ